MKLELGSGANPTPGFVHLDNNPDFYPDILADASRLTSVVDMQTVTELKANHILEHFSWRITVSILREWRQVLVDGGTIHIEVPNMEWQVKAYANGDIDAQEFVYYAYGGQDFAGNDHYAGFDYLLLRKVLSEAGFNNIVIQDVGQVLVADAEK